MATTHSTYFTPLTERKKLYLQGLSQGMSRTGAARFAGYSAGTRPAHIETQKVKAAFAQLMRVAASPQRIVQVISEGLDASRTVVIDKTTVEVPDFRERREYSKLAAEWSGYVEKEKTSSESNVAVGITLINGITLRKKEQNED